jgi:hypothetical protein
MNAFSRGSSFLSAARRSAAQPVIHGAIMIADFGRPGRDQIGDVDSAKRDVVERAVGLRRIGLDDLQVFGIFDDVELADRKPFPASA